MARSLSVRANLERHRLVMGDFGIERRAVVVRLLEADGGLSLAV